MKKIVIVIAVLSGVFSGQAQENQVFYYGEQDEKIYLDKIENTKIIHFGKTVDSLQKNRIVSQLRATDCSVEIITPLMYSVLGKNTRLENNPIIASAQKESSILYVSDMLMYKDSTRQWLSNEIIVTIHPESDIQNVLSKNKIPFVNFRQIGDSRNYVYIRVTNKETTVSSNGNERLDLYWSKSGVGSSDWPRIWDGSEYFFSKYNQTQIPIPTGGLVGYTILPQIAPNGEAIVCIPWDVPDPQPYYGISGLPEPWHFCLLARIVAPHSDDMTHVETKDVNYNTKYNNNIAWKNLSILNPSEGSIGATVFVANWSDIIKTYCLKFQPEINAVNLHQEAEITVKLGNTLYQAWTRGGRISQGIEIKADGSLLIKNANAKLCNLIFEPEEFGLLSVKFNFLTREKTDQEEYDFHVIQTEEEGAEEIILGGEVYHVIAPPRNLFYAAAEDVYAIEGDEIALIAEDIGESATYRWYDADGNLVCEDMELSTIAERETHYKLEVTAVSDGYKDYATATVRIVPGKIEEVYPNPTSDDVTIRCVFDSRVKNAYIQISDYFKAPPVGISLNTSPQNVVVNMRIYPIGTYIVTLICDGVVVDTKTFVRH